MSKIADLLSAHQPLSLLSNEVLEALASCATLNEFSVGDRLMREGESADTFHVLLYGRVAVEIANLMGGPMVIETLEAGEVVGISWMLPPYRSTFDARAVTDSGTVAIDALRLRGACDADPAMGYVLYKHLAGMIRDRLQATRLQLLDLYRSHDS